MRNTLRDKLYNVWNFMIHYRRNGTTTLLEKLASENDLIIVVATAEEKDKFKGKAITFQEITENVLQGKNYDGLPMLMDNHTMIQLAENTVRVLDRNEELIKMRDEFISLYLTQVEDGYDAIRKIQDAGGGEYPKLPRKKNWWDK